MPKKLQLFLAVSLLTLTAFAAGFMINSWAAASKTELTVPAAAAPAPAAVAAAPSSDTAALEAAIRANTADEEAPAEDGGMMVADLEALAQFAAQEPDLMVSQVVTGSRGGPKPGGHGVGPIGQDGPYVSSVISKVENSGAKLTLKGQQIVNLNDQTVVGDANGTLKREDLKQNDRIIVLGKVETDKSLTARWVLRLPPLPSVLIGTVVSVDAAANSLKVKSDKDSAEWTVSVTASTPISKNGATAKLADLTANERVSVIGKADTTTKKLEAERIVAGQMRGPGGSPRMPNRDSFVRGTVKSIDVAGNSFVVTEKNGQGQADTDRKVVVDSTTRYAGTGLKALADLKVGDTVAANGDKQTDGSLKAKSVSKGTVRSQGGPGGQSFEFFFPDNRRGGQEFNQNNG